MDKKCFHEYIQEENYSGRGEDVECKKCGQLWALVKSPEVKENERIRNMRIGLEHFWKSEKGEETKKHSSAYMKLHGSEFRARKRKKNVQT